MTQISEIPSQATTISEPTSQPRAAGRLRDGLQRYGTTLIGLIVFFVVWELIIVVFNVPRYIIPKPSLIFANYFNPAINKLIVENAAVTGYETLLGFFIAVSLGVPLAMF